MDSQPTPAREREHFSVPLELSNATVRLYKEHFGRGPTKARTLFADNNTLLITLEDSLTPAERRLAEMGEHQRLRDTRLFFQHATEQEFRDTVERITGRTVIGFVSGIDTQEDISCEIFYLKPEADGNAAPDTEPDS
jgi:uncharacterized protein YbcI